VIVYLEDMASIDVAWAHYGTVVEVVAGSSSRHMVACSYCTFVEGTVDVGVDMDADADCMVSVFLHLAACLALPADDGHSSCRLGSLCLPNRPRPASGWRCAFCGLNGGGSLTISATRRR
jgi:hypothetical protein